MKQENQESQRHGKKRIVPSSFLRTSCLYIIGTKTKTDGLLVFRLTNLVAMSTCSDYSNSGVDDLNISLTSFKDKLLSEN